MFGLEIGKIDVHGPARGKVSRVEDLKYYRLVVTGLGLGRIDRAKITGLKPQVQRVGCLRQHGVRTCAKQSDCSRSHQQGSERSHLRFSRVECFWFRLLEDI